MTPQRGFPAPPPGVVPVPLETVPMPLAFLDALWTGADVKLWMSLIRFAREIGHAGVPKPNQWLADQTGLSVGQVERSLAKFTDAGWIVTDYAPHRARSRVRFLWLAAALATGAAVAAGPAARAGAGIGARAGAGITPRASEGIEPRAIEGIEPRAGAGLAPGAPPDVAAQTGQDTPVAQPSKIVDPPPALACERTRGNVTSVASLLKVEDDVTSSAPAEPPARRYAGMAEAAIRAELDGFACRRWIATAVPYLEELEARGLAIPAAYVGKPRPEIDADPAPAPSRAKVPPPVDEGQAIPAALRELAKSGDEGAAKALARRIQTHLKDNLDPRHPHHRTSTRLHLEVVAEVALKSLDVEEVVRAFGVACGRGIVKPGSIYALELKPHRKAKPAPGVRYKVAAQRSLDLE